MSNLCRVIIDIRSQCLNRISYNRSSLDGVSVEATTLAAFYNTGEELIWKGHLYPKLWKGVKLQNKNIKLEQIREELEILVYLVVSIQYEIW